LGIVVLGSPARAQVKLEPKFPPGRVLEHRTMNKTQQVLTLGGMPIETESTDAGVTEESAGQPREDGSIPLTFQVKSLKVDLSLPGGLSVSFDSAEPDAKIDPPQLAFIGDILKLMSRVRFVVVVDQANKPKAVEGTETIRAEAQKLGDPARLSVMGRFDVDKIKTRIEQSNAKLPDILVRSGETWERTETLDLDAGQVITFRKKYEYLGTEKKGDLTFDKIGVKATEVTYSQDPTAQLPLRLTKSDLKIASSDGALLFDRERGYFVREHEKDHIKGSITFEANGKEIPGTLDLTFDRTTETSPPESK
jgi:hypothetical protein